MLNHWKLLLIKLPMKALTSSNTWRLLTYGAEPNETINLLKSFSKDNECVFIKGNHDQFYFDIENGLDPFKYNMPKFVKESIIGQKQVKV